MWDLKVIFLQMGNGILASCMLAHNEVGWDSVFIEGRLICNNDNSYIVQNCYFTW